MEVQFASGKKDVENSYTIEYHCCPENDDAEFVAKLAQKRRIACRSESLDVDAPINADLVVKGDDAVSKGRIEGDRVVWILLLMR